ncbi:MAG TPA: FHA domain-containing protein, partial [Stenomitos sp.]
MVFARLQLLSNTDDVKDVFLVTPRTRFTIGRSRSNVLVLRHPKVLPLHALILWSEDRFAIQRCHADAEIWLNREVIASDAPHPLKSGDAIQVGETSLKFDLSAASDRKASPTSNLPVTLVAAPTHSHTLQVSTPDWVQEFALTYPTLYLGSDPKCDICVDWPGVAPQQLKFTWHKNSYQVLNLVPEVPLTDQGQSLSQKVLEPDDVLVLNHSLTLQYGAFTPPTDAPQVEAISLRNRTYVSLGRDPRNDIVLDHPMVSRFHAALEWQTGSWLVKDLNSSNNTF